MATKTAQESQSAEDWRTTRATVRERTAFLFNNSILSNIKFVVNDSAQFGSHNLREMADDEESSESSTAGSDVELLDNVEFVDSHNVSQNKSSDKSGNGKTLGAAECEDDSPDEVVEGRDQDVRKVRIPAHKLVLAIGSPVFEAMFYGDLAEKGNEIELPDTESHYLLEFLRFLYCDESKLTVENVFGVLYLAEKYIVPCLAAKCWSFIDEDPSVCLKSSGAVASLNRDTLVSLLKRDSLCIKEFDLFAAVKNWAEAKCKENDLEPNGKTMREIIGEAVDFIRFPAISLKDFARNVVRSEILTSDEALEVHQYFAREIAAKDIKFPTSYRAGLASTAIVHEYCTYDEGVSLQIVQGVRNTEKGSLKLVVESRNVHLRGVCLLTSRKEGQEFSATVRLLDANGHKLATETGHFRAKMLSTTLEEKNLYGFDVKFAVPVLLSKSSRYTIHTEVASCDESFFYKVSRDPCSLASVAFHKSLYFTFSGTTRHIFKLLFHKLD